jgi:hypothetical protein
LITHNENAKIKLAFKELLAKEGLARRKTQAHAEFPTEEKTNLYFEWEVAFFIQDCLKATTKPAMIFILLKTDLYSPTINPLDFAVALVLASPTPSVALDSLEPQEKELVSGSTGISISEFMSVFSSSETQLTAAINSINQKGANTNIQSMLLMKNQWPILRNFFINRKGGAQGPATYEFLVKALEATDDLMNRDGDNLWPKIWMYYTAMIRVVEKQSKRGLVPRGKSRSQDAIG